MALFTTLVHVFYAVIQSSLGKNAHVSNVDPRMKQNALNIKFSTQDLLYYFLSAIVIFSFLCKD